MFNTFFEGNIPGWYELKTGEDCLFVCIYMEVIEFILEHSFGYAQSVSKLAAPFQFSRFICLDLEEKTWGFGRVSIIEKEPQKDWIAFKFKIPSCTKNSWKALYDISATLNVLINFLSLFRINGHRTNSKFSQLLTLDFFATKEGLHGAEFSASVSPALCRWIAKHPGEFMDEDVVSRMKYISDKMSGTSSRGVDFSAIFSKTCEVFFRCPGNACGLAPNDFEDPLKKGYQFRSHNCDTPMQQLTLLFGVAKMCQMAREDGY